MNGCIVTREAVTTREDLQSLAAKSQTNGLIRDALGLDDTIGLIITRFNGVDVVNCNSGELAWMFDEQYPLVTSCFNTFYVYCVSFKDSIKVANDVLVDISKHEPFELREPSQDDNNIVDVCKASDITIESLLLIHKGERI